MRPLRVLLVEDEVLIAILFAEVLEEMGHNVCAIESTEADAVAAAAKLIADLIIADAKLRKGSGDFGPRDDTAQWACATHVRQR